MKEQRKWTERGEVKKKESRIAKDRPKEQVRWKALQSVTVEERVLRIRMGSKTAKAVSKVSHLPDTHKERDRNNPGKPA